MNDPSPTQGMCFGLDRATDEYSLALLLKLVADPKLAGVLIPRLASAEIDHLAEVLYELMRKHLNEDEYHRLFLGDEDHHH
jgi:hypothetical protein